MKAIIIITGVVLVLGVGSSASAGEGRGATAPVPGSVWFALTPAQRCQLSHKYADQMFRAERP